MPPDIRWQQRFASFCFELGWNTLRDLLLAEGNADLIGSRDTLRMVQDRNLTSHTYNRASAEQVSREVEDRYLPCFRELRRTLNQRLARTASEAADG